MLKKLIQNKNIPYITIPITIIAFVFLGMTILNYSGVINIVSNNFFAYINQDIQYGRVAGEYTVGMAVGNICTHYAAPNASSGGGTKSNPWSIEKAFTDARPGNVVCFRGGFYQPSNGVKYSARVSGTSGNWITFRNYSGETPIIDGSRHTSRLASDQYGLDLGGDYTMLKGFEVRNFHYSGGVKIRANHLTLEDNFIHHNADHNFNPPPGQTGIICDTDVNDPYKRCSDGIDSRKNTSYLIMRRNIIWANGHNRGYDHGLYLHASNSIIERNIFAFNASGGAGSRSVNSKFYHNVFYKNYHAATGDNKPAENNEWKNNIVVGGLWAFMHSHGSHDISHFLVYHPNGPDGWNDGRAAPFSRSSCPEYINDKEVSAWKYYCEPSNTIEDNPMFVDPPKDHLDFSFNFRLKAGSPAINSGANLGSKYVGNAPDRGAYEYGDSGKEAVCGNGQCETGETPTICPADCQKTPPPSCTGDTCSSNQTCSNWIDQSNLCCSVVCKDSGNRGGDKPISEALANLNGDDKIDIQDFGILLSNWHKQGDKIINKKADIEKDDIVDIIDLTRLLSCWGTPTMSESPKCWGEEVWEEGLGAFPGAQGFGTEETIGGRGGQVIEVTNLDDSGSGSLREAVETKGPRIVVFKVGGTIELESGLEITEPYLTIAGQTAPGDGITIKAMKETAVTDTHDVIIRYIRFRGVEIDNQDCLNVVRSHNVVIDHNSLSWCTDETLSVVAQSYNVTLQWNIISEPLGGYSGKGTLVSSGSHNVSVHHNLYAHSSQRNAKMKGSDDPYSLEGNIPYFDYVNNVVYNWSGYAHSVAGSGKGNVVANYFKPGPNTHTYPRRREVIRQQYEEGRLLYVKNNIGPSCPEGCENDWEGGTFTWDGKEYTGGMVSDISGDITPTITRTDTPLPTPKVQTYSAERAYTKVLEKAGVSVPKRDSVDIRIINDVKNGTGKIITDMSEIDGWPTLSSGTPYTDTDHDGMADSWEDSNGFDKNDPSDGPLDKDGDGYTNVEEYLNSLVN